ncbi:unnamed protein product [Blepharisma stoltei]|uniref:Photosystem I assembly protein Ycf3 n=1 Tax=Blepharisma stoltei TaxID=1481888 RepID=A0AAU9IAE7_9CILI|nr:unnamed protein product [Blepharisma stoltei]
MERSKIMLNPEARILQLNKTAMGLLGNDKNALKYLQKAEKILLDGDAPEILKMSNRLRLMATTYNNYGCYYKTMKQPNAALYYLKKTLKLEAQAFADPVAIASTQLNICAIYSQLGKHDIAISYAKQSLNLLSKFEESDEIFPENSYSTLAVCYFNIGAELEFMRRFDDAIKYYQSGYRIAISHLGASHELTRRLYSSMSQLGEKNETLIRLKSQRQVQRSLGRISHIEIRAKSAIKERMDTTMSVAPKEKRLRIHTANSRPRSKSHPKRNLNKSCSIDSRAYTLASTPHLDSKTPELEYEKLKQYLNSSKYLNSSIV